VSFNVLVLIIDDVVVVVVAVGVVEIMQVLIHIYSVDKVVWVYVFEDKVELVEVCCKLVFPYNQ
jgi:hypothetical protein